MPLNASISPSTTPRTAPCRVQATSGSLAVQPGTCAEAVEAVTANRKRAKSLGKCAMVASFHVTAGPTIPPYSGNIDTADQSHRQTLRTLRTSAVGLGRVKTPAFNQRIEIPSRCRQFENQK